MWVKVADKMVLNVHFGTDVFQNFRGFLGVYLRLTDRSLSPDRHFVFSSIMSKTRIRFL